MRAPSQCVPAATLGDTVDGDTAEQCASCRVAHSPAWHTLFWGCAVKPKKNDWVYQQSREGGPTTVGGWREIGRRREGTSAQTRVVMARTLATRGAHAGLAARDGQRQTSYGELATMAGFAG